MIGQSRFYFSPIGLIRLYFIRLCTISVVESAGEYEEIFPIGNNKLPLIMMNIKINGTPVKMELDSGAARSIMPKAIYMIKPGQ